MQDLSQNEILDRSEELLRAVHGSPDLGNHTDPLDELVFILLSGQTHFKNYERTWKALRASYPDWEAFEAASEAEIERLIADGGLGRQKARLLKLLFEELRERVDGLTGAEGPLSLSFLKDWKDADVLAFLTTLPGVGPKTARCVMLYSLGRDTCPVDTHVYRVLRRMGVLGPQVGIKAAHEAVDLVSPARRKGSLHINLVAHGRQTCKPRTPLCAGCPLVSFCETGQREVRSLNDAPAVIDIFAGAGGLSDGFRKAGYRIAAAVELDRHAAQTFRLNFPGTPVIEADLRTLPPEAIGDLTGIAPGGVSVLCAGPPCQGYSEAGKRDVDDPQNRLFEEFIRIAEELQPHLMVLENVEGLRRRSNALFEHAVLRALAAVRPAPERGYHVRHALFDVADFGVPQRRRRMIYLAVRQDLGRVPELPEPTHSNDEQSSVFGVGGSVRWMLPQVTVGEALQGLPSLAAGEGGEILETESGRVFNHHAMLHSEAVQAKIAALSPGKGPISYRRLATNKPAHTVTAGHNALPAHQDSPRSITVREAARLQSFHDGFRFLGPRHAQALQVANAVPPRFAYVLALCSKRAQPWVGLNRNGGGTSVGESLVDDDAFRVRELVAQGRTDADIAAQMAVTVSALRRFRSRAGISRRRSGRAAVAAD